MAAKKAYTKVRYFEINEDNVNALLFPDDSEDEMTDLDDEDIEVVELAAADGHQMAIIGTETVELPASKEPVSETNNTGKLDLKKTPNFSVSWKSNDFSEVMPPTVTRPLAYGEINDGLLRCTSEIEVFKKVCDFDVLVNDILITETMRYSRQNGNIFETSYDEISAFLAINLFMGYHKLPSIRHYWSTKPDLSVPYVADVMTLKRYETIRQLLHFNDNDKAKPRGHPDFDRAYKIRPVYDHMNAAFQFAMTAEENQSIDERMVKFKGHNIMKQYIKSKPVKWGFKVWVRAGANSGYVYQMDPYTGKTDTVEYGVGEAVVWNLCSNLVGTGCHIFCDNFFSSPKLLYMLHENGLSCTGTVRSNRKEMPSMKSDKEMKKGDISSHQSEDSKLNCVKWIDTRPVHVISNCLPCSDTIVKYKKQKGTADKSPINIPVMINRYNCYMGGVDLSDQYKSYYAIDLILKKKYYLRPFFDILDTCVVNSFIVFNKVQAQNGQKPVKHLEFRQAIVHALIGQFCSRKQNKPSAPVKRKATAPLTAAPAHLPKIIEPRKRCKLCTQNNIENRTNIICETCGIPLCIQSQRNCFADFHKQ